DLLLVLAVAQRAELFAEPELGHHAAGQIGRSPDVVGSPGRDLSRPKDQLFGNPATEEAGDHRFELLLGLAVFVTLGQKHSDAERTAARKDRYLVQRLVPLGI